jgi:hypothetical protein
VSLLRALARRHAWLAALLLVLAMGARAAVPQGYMPEVRADGAVGLVPCTGTAAMPAPMAGMHHHAMHGGEDGDAAHHTDQPCAFSGLAGPALLHAPQLELPAIAVSATAYAQTADAALRLAERIPRPPSRGPPIPA